MMTIIIFIRFGLNSQVHVIVNLLFMLTFTNLEVIASPAGQNRSCPGLTKKCCVRGTIATIISIFVLMIIGFRCVNYVEGRFEITFLGIGQDQQILEHEFERSDDEMPKQISYGRPNAPLINISLPLPSRPMPFVGRKELINEIIQRLLGTHTSIVGLFGPPAFGKSSLAIHVGHEVMNKKGVSVSYVDLSEFRLSFEQQPHARSHVRGVQIHGDNFGKRLLGRSVNGDHLLNWAATIENISILIFDNCDPVLNKWHDEFQEFILDLRKSSRNNLKVIITSQLKISFVDHFTDIEVLELSDKDSKSLISVLRPNLNHHLQTEIVELVGNCPLAIKVAVMLLKTISPTMLIQDLKAKNVDVISSSQFPRRERFNVVMDTACQYLSNNSIRAAYLFSLFPGSFDEDVLSFSFFREFRDEVNNLFERSLFERYAHIFGERYKLHKLIKTYFREKILIDSKNVLKSDFKTTFVEYYTKKLYNYLTSIKSIKEPAQKDQLITSEQHNIRQLARILLSTEDHYFSSEEIIVLLFYSQQGGLESNHSSIILDVTLTFLEENNTLLNKACSQTYTSVCKVLISDLLLSITETGYTYLPCTICDTVSGPDKLMNFITDDLLQLIDNSYVFCSQNNFAHNIVKILKYLLFSLECWFSLQYSSVVFRVQMGKTGSFQSLLHFLYFFLVIQTIESYVMLCFTIFLLVILYALRGYIWNKCVTTHLFFLCILYLNFYVLGVLANALGYFSLEGNGSMRYQQWCLLCIHLTCKNSFWIANFLNNLICSVIFPGIPLYFIARYFVGSIISLFMSDFHQFVYTSKRRFHN